HHQHGGEGGCGVATGAAGAEAVAKEPDERARKAPIGQVGVDLLRVHGGRIGGSVHVLDLLQGGQVAYQLERSRAQRQVVVESARVEQVVPDVRAVGGAGRGHVARNRRRSRVRGRRVDVLRAAA